LQRKISKKFGKNSHPASKYKKKRKKILVFGKKE
jgi:hypothetical protein